MTADLDPWELDKINESGTVETVPDSNFLVLAGDGDPLEGLASLLLSQLGEDPTRPGLVDTPRRWANFWRDFTNYDPGKTSTTFEAVTVDQLVIISGIRVYSICEHHLLPFWCDISIAYVAGAKVLGLSKFARVAHKHAHRLQLQERLVNDIAKEIQELTGSPDVAVLATGTHLCMVMRGIKTGANMTTSVLFGKFREDPTEYLSLLTSSQAHAIMTM